MAEELIQFIGVSELDVAEQTIVNELSTEYYQKIKRALKNLTSLAVHVKVHSKQGSKKKYTIKIRAIAPTSIIESKMAADWDLGRTLHKAFKNVEREIEHKLMVSSGGLKAHQK
jgi:hypothetical protein